MDVDQSIGYNQLIIRGTALRKYKQVLEICKESKKGLAGDQWAMGPTKDVTMEQFWTLEKVDVNNGSGGMNLHKWELPVLCYHIIRRNYQ